MEVETDHVTADHQHDDDYNNNSSSNSKVDYGNDDDGERTAGDENNIYDVVDGPVDRTDDLNNDYDGRDASDVDDPVDGNESHLQQQWQQQTVANEYQYDVPGDNEDVENVTEYRPEEVQSEQIYDQAFSGTGYGNDDGVTRGGDYDYEYNGYEVGDQTIGGGGGGDPETAEAFGQSLYDSSELHRYDVDADDAAEIGLFSAAATEPTYDDVQSAVSPPPEPQVSPAPVPPEPAVALRNNKTSAAPEQRNSAASGKFVLRASRQPDALHFINTIRQAAATADSPGKDEIITVLRSTIQAVEENKRTDQQSVVKSRYVQAYEANIISGLASPSGPAPVTSPGFATKPRIEPERKAPPVVNSTSVVEVKESASVSAVSEHDGLSPVEVPNESRTDSSQTSTQPVEPKISASSVSNYNSQDEVFEVKSPTAGEQPSWMSAALEKQKRSTDIIQALEKSKAGSTSTSSEPEQTRPPWMKDRVVKKPFTLATAASAPPVALATPPEETPAANSVTSGGSNTSAAVEQSVPQWKVDIESRKKTKSYVSTQKPEQPLRLGGVPDWKKQLQEKAKMKRGQSVDSNEDGSLPSPGAQPASAVVSPTSPWRQEIAQLKKLSVSSPEEESVSKPEWLRIAEEKQKTVSTGSSQANGV